MAPPRYAGVHGKGPIEASRKDLWVQAASQGLLDLLDDELALVVPEIEARLSDTGITQDGKKLNFDPHILTEARNQLVELGAIDEVEHRTKGGTDVTVLVPADRRRRTTAIDKRVARKAMLYRRFLTLMRTAGDAGELVLRTSLSRAQEDGVPYLPMASRFGEVPTVLGERPYGAFDSGAFLHTTDPNGVPTRPIALPVEMKNRRLTLYPLHKEVHQLLSKCATLQMAQPDYPITPILVCRKAHARLFWMASNLGFRIWATRLQYVFTTKDIPDLKIAELRGDLGMKDITTVDRANPPRIEKFFMSSLPNVAHAASADWSEYAETVEPYSDKLRRDDLPPLERLELVSDLRQRIVELHREWGIDPPFTWAVSEDEDHEEHAV